MRLSKFIVFFVALNFSQQAEFTGQDERSSIQSSASRLNNFLDAHPSFRYEGAESLEQYSIALNQGISFEMLSVLIEGIALKYKRLTHLPFWATSTGHALFEIEKEQPIKILPGKYIVEVLENYPDLINWISRAYYEARSMGMVTVMALLPEKAEDIYNNYGSFDNFKWVFVTENLSAWRKEYAAIMDWNNLKWDDMLFRDVMHVINDSNQKDNERFDLVIKSLGFVHDLPRVFGRGYSTLGLGETYQKKSLDHDGPEFFYMKLKQRGYPIDNIPNDFNDEIEAEILSYHKEKDTSTGWVYFKLAEIMKIYPYSKHLASGSLHMSVDKLLFTPNDDLFKSWFSKLAEAVSEFVGGNVDFEIPQTNKLGNYIIGKILCSITFKEDPAIFYPKLISRVKRETDAKGRAFLVETILPPFIFSCFGSDLPRLFIDSVYLLLAGALKDDMHIFDDWTEDFAYLFDDFNKVYQLRDSIKVLREKFQFYLWSLGLPKHKTKVLKEYFENYKFTNDFFDDLRGIIDYSDCLVN